MSVSSIDEGILHQFDLEVQQDHPIYTTYHVIIVFRQKF